MLFFVKKALKFTKREFIAQLEFAVVFVLLLYSVVGQMYQFVTSIRILELLAARPDVSISVYICH